MALYPRLLFALFVGLADGFPRLPCKAETSAEGDTFFFFQQLEDVVEEFSNLYESYTDPVIEVMDAVVLHQISGISKSFLKVVESFRLILCQSVCPDACNFGGPDMAGTFFIDHWITELHRNVECISNSANWREQVSDFMFSKWAGIRSWLERMVERQGSTDISREDLLQIVNGAREIYVGILRPAFSVLVTSNSYNMSHILVTGQNARTENSWLQPLTLNLEDEDSKFDLETKSVPHLNVLQLHENPRKAIHTPNFQLKSDVCRLASRGGTNEREMLHAGGIQQDPDILTILKRIEPHVPLSHAFVGWRLGDMDPEMTDCRGKGIFYDPIICLEQEGWGGYRI